MHNWHNVHKFWQVGWIEPTEPCSMSASKTNKCYTLYLSHPSWENFLWSHLGTLGPFPSAWETSWTRLMGLPVTLSQARVTDAECGMSIPGPWHGPKQCSIEWYQCYIGCDILLLIRNTQIMHKLCILCIYYANIMQKLRRNYAENMQILCRYYVYIMQIMQILCRYYANIMQKLCKYYAEFMQKLCRYYAKYANIMQKLCKNYADIM